MFSTENTQMRLAPKKHTSTFSSNLIGNSSGHLCAFAVVTGLHWEYIFYKIRADKTTK